jgi:2,3-bisphosphoglycerate-independent phosphoglycerate mutase
MGLKPVVLCILDGWGISPDPSVSAPAQAHTPNFDAVMDRWPHSTLTTFGPEAGLPRGQMGNSEVGHTNIGAGRVVAMDLGQIDLAIEEDTLRDQPALQRFIARMQASGGVAHLMGVVSDGGVHGHIEHVLAATEILCNAGIKVILHAITDGRDVAPKSADGFIAALTERLPAGARVGTVIGRYWAMDRDTRWERVQTAWAAMVRAEGGARASDPAEAIRAAYARGETDEFITATVVGSYAGMADGDGLFCLNFRADRAREILEALCRPEFDAFERPGLPRFAATLGMVEYSEAHADWLEAVFPPRDIVNTLGAWVAQHGLRQFRLAETEKYPHVTFFLNGGKESPEPGEDRFMPPSPKVATYDLQPEMAAAEVTDKLVEAIAAGYDLIVVNYANPDMVGHTGDMAAAKAACEAVDAGLGAALSALEAAGGAMVLTADHGNCDCMVDPVTGGPHTAHTLNPVPVAVIGAPEGSQFRDGGKLADLAPTVLALMGLPQPDEMTGESLLIP